MSAYFGARSGGPGGDSTVYRNFAGDGLSRDYYTHWEVDEEEVIGGGGGGQDGHLPAGVRYGRGGESGVADVDERVNGINRRGWRGGRNAEDDEHDEEDEVSEMARNTRRVMSNGEYKSSNNNGRGTASAGGFHVGSRLSRGKSGHGHHEERQNANNPHEKLNVDFDYDESVDETGSSASYSSGYGRWNIHQHQQASHKDPRFYVQRGGDGSGGVISSNSAKLQFANSGGGEGGDRVSSSSRNHHQGAAGSRLHSPSRISHVHYLLPERHPEEGDEEEEEEEESGEEEREEIQRARFHQPQVEQHRGIRQHQPAIMNKQQGIYHGGSARGRAPPVPEKFHDEKEGSEIYVMDTYVKPPASVYSHYTDKSRAPSEMSSVKTKTSRKGGVVVETMSAPNPCCPNTKGVCCLLLLVNLGLILVTLGFSIVLQLYDPPFVWYCGVAFLIVGFIALFASLIFCVHLCRESEEARRHGVQPGEMYWTHHWQKRIPLPGMSREVEKADDVSTVYSTRNERDEDKYYQQGREDRRGMTPIHTYGHH